jgi:hypothetical protein
MRRWTCQSCQRYWQLARIDFGLALPQLVVIGSGDSEIATVAAPLGVEFKLSVSTAYFRQWLQI